MNKQVAIKPEQSLPVAQSESDQLIDIIGRLASDPNSDIDKMERLMAMRDKVQSQERKVAFNNALADAQCEMPVITKRGKGRNNDYALWEDLNEKTKPVLAKNGLVLTFSCEEKETILTVKGTLHHRNGHSITASFQAPIEIIKSKQGNNVINGSQARGSAMSYGKRYVTIGLLNISAVGEDDDAYSTETDFDTTEWTARILEAKSMDELKAIGADLKETKMPHGARTLLQSAWAGQAKEVNKKVNNESS